MKKLYQDIRDATLFGIFLFCVLWLITGCSDEVTKTYDAHEAMYRDDEIRMVFRDDELFKIRKQTELLNRQIYEMRNDTCNNENE